MTREEIKYKLGKIGMRCFVNCFKKAWEELKKGAEFIPGDILIVDPDIIEEARKRTGEDVTKKSLSSRCSKIRKIFENNGHMEALQICIESKKTGLEMEKMRAKARELRDHYSQKNN